MPEMGVYGWKLTFADEFEDAGPAIAKGAASECFTDQPLCLDPFWSERPCDPAYDTQLRNLNKCNWKILNFVNWMDNGAPEGGGINAFHPSQIKVENGNLYLLATRSPFDEGSLDCKRTYFDSSIGANNLTKRCAIWSGAMESKHHEYQGKVTGFSQEYGRFEVRAKLPYGPGSWPAHWLLPEGPQPQKVSSEACNWSYKGELDIMEAVPDEPEGYIATYHGAICDQEMHLQKAEHFTPPKKLFPGMSERDRKLTLFNDFHVYALEWDANAVRFIFDDYPVMTISRGDLIEGSKGPQNDGPKLGKFPAEIPSGPFFWILNSTILKTSSWPKGPHLDTYRFLQQTHTIDYVRTYRECGPNDPKDQCTHFQTKDAAWFYNSDRGETAGVELNVYPSPIQKGDTLKVRVTSFQSCAKMKIFVINMAGQMVRIDNPENPSQTDYIYNGAMEANEVKTLSVGTDSWAAGMYLATADFQECGPDRSGQGNHAFKFIVL